MIVCISPKAENYDETIVSVMCNQCVHICTVPTCMCVDVHVCSGCNVYMYIVCTCMCVQLI